MRSDEAPHVTSTELHDIADKYGGIKLLLVFELEACMGIRQTTTM
jgi:hypothetical protein